MTHHILIYEGVYIYLTIVDEMIKNGEDYRDGRAIFNKFKSNRFRGKSSPHLKMFKIIIKWFMGVDLVLVTGVQGLIQLC